MSEGAPQSDLHPSHPFAGLPAEHYRAILADPPWQFETWSHRGQGRGASQHYDTMPTDAICRLPVATLAAKNCTLFLWGTWPHLPDALRVVTAWGFTFKTCGFVWVKLRTKAPTLWCDLNQMFKGLGYGTRSNTEFCLRATRGTPGAANDRGIDQVIVAPRREHSRKPDEQYDRIERLVDGPYLELFARNRRPGWDAWGNQTDRFPSVDNRRDSADQRVAVSDREASLA